MALLLPKHNAVFIHVPKTGGLFITNYLRKINVPFRMIGYRHSPVDLIGMPSLNKGMFKFCFIRKPDEWYQSYWQMRIGEVGGKGGHLGIGKDLGGLHPLYHPTWEIDPYCMSPDLNEYIKNCIGLDGYLTRLYNRFIGVGRMKCNYVGRFENFHEDLVEVFNHIGIKFDQGALKQAPKYNPSKKVQMITPENRAKILEVESGYKLIKRRWI